MVFISRLADISGILAERSFFRIELCSFTKLCCPDPPLIAGKGFVLARFNPRQGSHPPV
jgi:hypothetical protein